MRKLKSALKDYFSERRRRKGTGNTFSKSIKNTFLAALVLIAILLFGSLGYILLEEMSILDSLWMTVITMSTVGFGEVVPLDAYGRVLTIIVILSTILVGGFALGNIGAFVFGGEIVNIVRGRRLERDIERLKNHVILVGFGRVGKEAAAEWSDGDLVVVEHDPEVAQESVDAGYLTVEGDSTQDSTLISAGIERARAIMIATGHIADNVLISLTARELNPEIIISARGDSMRSEARLKRAGANMVVLPHRIGGRRLAIFLKHPNIVDFLDLVMKNDDLSLRLQEFKISVDCSLTGRTLGEADIRNVSGGALIMAIRRREGELLVPPSADYSIEQGDVLITLGTNAALENMCKLTS